MRQTLRWIPIATLAFAAALVAAPAAAGPEDGEKSAKRMELVRDHLKGEPVERVRFLRPMYGYEVVDDHAIIVWESAHRAWLVGLHDEEGCQHLAKDHTVVVSTFRDSLNTSNGVVTSTGGTYCRMKTIQEVDVKAWREAEREAGLRK